MHFPQNLHYSKDHIWVRFTGHKAILGITEFAQSQLGDIVFVDIEKENATVEENDIFCSVEAIKTISDLLTPISGKIVTTNQKLEDNPELINKDPYDKGWIIEIEFENKPPTDHLLSSIDYQKIIHQ